MNNLLLRNIFNRKLENQEMLQIAFDKKNKVERIFGNDGEDIYYIEDEEKRLFKRIGTLFLDYISDDVSDIFSNFIKDIRTKDIQTLKEKYINAYIFYFKYFFDDRYNIEQLEYIKNIPEEQLKEIEKIVNEKIKDIEKAKTIEELINVYVNIIPQFKKIRNGTNFKNINEDNIHIALIGKFAKISNYFFKIAYLKQLYKLIIDYCYFRIRVFKTKIEKQDITSRYFNFKQEYTKIIKKVKNNDILPHLVLSLPPSIATITENGTIMYCYQLDEIDNKEKLFTNVFFSVSLIHLLENEKRIIKCENCNSYIVLKKERNKLL